MRAAKRTLDALKRFFMRPDPVEQVINTVNIVLRRQTFLLDYFTDAAANRPLVLTMNGYVGIGQTPAPQSAAKREYFSCRSELDKSAEWNENEHPRWPKGSPEEQGGRFRAKDEGDSDGKTAISDDCIQEWNSARKFCTELLDLHEFHPSRVLLGGHTTIDGCAKGFVSERCGGNKVG